ncbi:hypothetical protein Pelo_9873 [Pelomyxa schiedti]|nr:hypothetical protein Pelo_9873 [Pelomyxa schiedti]
MRQCVWHHHELPRFFASRRPMPDASDSMQKGKLLSGYPNIGASMSACFRVSNASTCAAKFLMKRRLKPASPTKLCTSAAHCGIGNCFTALSCAGLIRMPSSDISNPSLMQSVLPNTRISYWVHLIVQKRLGSANTLNTNPKAVVFHLSLEQFKFPPPCSYWSSIRCINGMVCYMFKFTRILNKVSLCSAVRSKAAFQSNLSNSDVGFAVGCSLPDTLFTAGIVLSSSVGFSILIGKVFPTDTLSKVVLYAGHTRSSCVTISNLVSVFVDRHLTFVAHGSHCPGSRVDLGKMKFQLYLGCPSVFLQPVEALPALNICFY